jgi:Sulfotransferase family
VGAGRLQVTVRDLGRGARRQARTATSSLRGLPDFLVIGAQKAGTTSLYAYLCAHPDIAPAGRKEVHYFDLNYDRGEAWYRSMFSVRARLAARERLLRRPQVSGEASPYYLFHPLAAERAAALIPSARLVVLLRDPVERAWSHYRHEVAAGREPLSFEAALDAEPERLAGTEQAIRSGAPNSAWENHRYFSYVNRGLYADQLRPWIAEFGRDRLLAVRAEDLFARPEEKWLQALGFLGLEPLDVPRFDVHNPGRDTGIEPALRARLSAQFAQPNDDLKQLLGPEFTWPADAE